MYHGKKIGVFVSHIYDNYPKRVCQGILERAKEFGFRVEMYSSLMEGENLGMYTSGEFSILSLPSFDELDGVIFLSGVYRSAALRERIFSLLLRHAEIPTVNISNDRSVFPTIMLDNNAPFSSLAAHMVDVHGAKRLCYLGSSIERKFSDIRENLFKATLQQRNIPVSDADIVLSGYDARAVKNALHTFTESGLPDCIVCYNDRMACLLMEAAAEEGFLVPDDFAVTGCDNTIESALLSPALTTITFPLEQLGAAAVDGLQRHFLGHDMPPVYTVTAEPLVRCSCGCRQYPNFPGIMLSAHLGRQLGLTEASIMHSLNLSLSTQNVGDIDDALESISSHVLEHEPCSEYYLCLYSDWNSISSHILEITANSREDKPSDMVLMKFGIRNGKQLPSCEFQKNTLLPPHILKDSDTPYLFIPLYFNEKAFGYVATAYENDQISCHFHSILLLMNLSRTLQSICEKKSAGLLIQRLETIYLKDSLTGLLNKHGFEQAEEALVINAKSMHTDLCCFFLDMDGLKTVNDTFGHGEGDFALQVIGQAIKSAEKPEDLSARFSGDEFYILGMDYSDDEAMNFIKNVKTYLANYNRLSDRPYLISVSGGYYIVPTDGLSDTKTVFDYFSKADQQMYAEKKRKARNVIK